MDVYCPPPPNLFMQPPNLSLWPVQDETKPEPPRRKGSFAVTPLTQLTRKVIVEAGRASGAVKIIDWPCGGWRLFSHTLSVAAGVCVCVCVLILQGFAEGQFTQIPKKDSHTLMSRV